MVNEEKYLEWMEEYFNSKIADENFDIKKALVDSNEDGILMLIWGSASYGRLGASVRNYMREYHPDIDDDFPNYCDFEDYSWELINKLINKWKRDIMCKKCGRIFGSVNCFDVDCPNNTPKK